MSEKLEPHDSSDVYAQTKGKRWYNVGTKIALSERGEKSRGAWIMLGMLVIVAVLGGCFIGYTLDTTVIAPPATYLGHCPPPGYIVNGGCYISETQVVGGTTTTITVTAGQIVVPP